MNNISKTAISKLRYLLIVIVMAAFPTHAFSYDIRDVPHEVGGFILGSSVADYPDIEHSNYLKEVVVTDWRGFRKGIISYGVCESPGTIVKIRMKYEDDSKKYFNKLFKMFKEKFGQPDLWKGDSFGVLHIWKWKFTDGNGQLVNLRLQHNLQDPNQTIGNEVKLSLPLLEERERLCFIESCDLPKNETDKKRKEEMKKTDWSYLIPR